MASAIHFDPYHKWLGIPPEEQPPHHYRLLGIKAFESDADVIQSAADQRMAHVRTYQSGAHGELSQRILNELAAARVCLLRPDRKAAYDEELRIKFAACQPLPRIASQSSLSLVKTLPLAPATVMPIAQPLPSPAVRSSDDSQNEAHELDFDVEEATSSRRRRPIGANQRLTFMLVGVVAAIVLVVGALWAKRRLDDASVAINSSGTTAGSNLPIPKAPPQEKAPQSETSTPPEVPKDPKPEPAKPSAPEAPVPFRRVPSVIDDSDATGFTKTGEGWQLFQNDAVSFKGTRVAHKPGDGKAVATWTFDGLQAGKPYKLLATWQGHEAQASNAQFHIQGATGGPKIVEVNQRSSSRLDMQANGNYSFQKLATVQCDSGTLTVSLTSAADNEVVADAVLIVPATDRDLAGTPDEKSPTSPQPVKPLLPEMPASRPTVARQDDPTFLTQFQAPVTGIVVVSGESRAMVSSLDAQNPASFWDLDDRVERRRIDINRIPYLSAAGVPGQRLFFLGAQNGIVSIWDLREDQAATVYTMSVTNGPASALAALADGNTLAIGGRQRVQLIRYTIMPAERTWNSNPTTRWDGFTVPVTALAVSPDGRRIVAGCGGTFIGDRPQSSDDMKIHAFDVPTKESKDFPGHQGSVWGMALSGDGSRLVTASSDGKVRLWDTANGKMLHEMSGHDGPALSVTISADGNTIVSGGDDATVRVWDARAGRVRGIFRGNTSSVRAIAYDGIRKRIVSGAQNGELRLFDASRTPLAAVNQPPENREAPPTEEAREAARKLMQEAFAGDIAKAKSPAEKAAVVETLLAQAAKSEDSAERFVLIEEARKMAIEAGDIDGTLSALRGQTDRYDVDRWTTYREAFEGLAKSVSTNTLRKQFAEAALEQAELAVTDEHYDDAKALLTAALGAAKKTGDAALQRQIVNRGKEVVELDKSFEAVRKATETLKATPEDPEAHLVLGKHLCFNRQDWMQGLPHLEKGSDGTLAEIAKQESKPPAGPEDQTNLADRWLELSAAAEGPTKLAMLTRAELWYREALPKLSGLAQTKVNKRLEELAALLDVTPKDSGPKTSEASLSSKTLAKKIKDAMKAKNLTRTPMYGTSRNQRYLFDEVPTAGMLLVGFNYAVESGSRVMSVQPIYAGVKQSTVGRIYGGDPVLGVAGKAIAPAGYAVGALEAYGEGTSLWGFTIVFMKVTKSGLDPADTKRSNVIGTNAFGGRVQKLGGDGQPVVGIFGSVRPVAYLEGLGLIQLGK